MNQAKRRTAAAAGFCLLFVLISLVMLATAYGIAGDRNLLAAEMRRYSPPSYSGLPDEEYPGMGGMIADYLMGRQDTFQYYFTNADGNMVACFAPHEESHMEDCRRLISLAGTIRWILCGAAAVLVGTGFMLRKYRRSFSAGMLAAFSFSAVIGLGSLIWGLISFDSLFTAFHRLLFTNDGWLLDSRTDMLIRLMPTSFFISLGIRILLITTFAMLVCFAGALMIRLKTKVKEETQEEPDSRE